MLYTIPEFFIPEIPFSNYGEIMRYFLGKSFQNDFLNCYKEDENFFSGRIFEITGSIDGNLVLNSGVKLRDYESLNKKLLIKNFDKIERHQKNIVELIHEGEFFGNLKIKIPLMNKEKYNLLEKFVNSNVSFNISNKGHKFNENHYQDVLISSAIGLNKLEQEKQSKIVLGLIYSKI